MGFQRQVGVQPIMAVPGDFASSNPRFVVDAGPGGLVSGVSCFVGRFGWVTPPLDPDGTGMILNSQGAGPVSGFIHREQTGILLQYLQEATLQLAAGFAVTAMSGGDFWVRNDGAGEALLGMKAYANFADGKVTFAATGTPLAGGVSTGTISAQTSSVTASITGDLMTVTAVGSGLLVPGELLTGAAAGTRIVSQVSSAEVGGTPQLTGTYRVSIPDQAVASTTITGTYGLFTAVSGLTGVYGVGSVLAGSGGGGVTTGTKITGLGTGVGGLGTYYVDTTQTVTSSSITSVGNVETKWVAMSQAPAGGLVKISDHVLG